MGFRYKTTCNEDRSALLNTNLMGLMHMIHAKMWLKLGLVTLITSSSYFTDWAPLTVGMRTALVEFVIMVTGLRFKILTALPGIGLPLVYHTAPLYISILLALKANM